MNDFLRVLDRLVRQPAVVGSEIPFFRFLTGELKRAGAKKVTLYEGLLVAEGSKPESVMLSAHVDRHGLISTGPSEVQYAAFVAGFKGWQTGDTVSELTYLSLAERFHKEPVYAYEPWSGKVVGKGRITGAELCSRRNDVLFKTEGLEKIMAGTPIAYVDKLERQGNRINAQLDNVVSVALILYLFQKGFQGRAFFTAQEEIGRSWRYLYEWFQRAGVESKDLLVLDTSPFPSPEAAEKQLLVLRNRDASADFNADTVKNVREICDSDNISYIFKDELLAAQNHVADKPPSLGRTELGRMIVGSEGRVTGTTIQIPTSGYHTQAESASVESLKAMLTVLGKLSDTKLKLN